MRLRAALVAFAAAALSPGHAPVSASPSAEELEERATALREKLDGQGYTVVVEAPFVVVGDETPKLVKKRAEGILRWSVSRYEADFFDKRPGKVIEVWLFKNERTYRKGAKKFFGDSPDTPYGYYSSEDDAIVMNIGPGAGTLTHEVVHPYIEADFPRAPAWLNEGLASLYERPTDRKGHIWGLPNWRLPNLKREIRADTLPALATLLGTSSDEFYGAAYDSYAYARYLMAYLQERGVLVDFYRKFRDDPDDRTGAATLRSVLGVDDLADLEPAWRRWVLGLEHD
jgi:hypothetical protein